MAVGPVQSGRQGKVTKVGTPDKSVEITKWNRQGEVDTDRYATSESNGFKVSEPGNRTATGTIEGKRRTDADKIEAIFQEGDKVTLKLGFNSTTGILQPATIKNVNYDVDVDSGAIQSYTINWEGNGESSYY